MSLLHAVFLGLLQGVTEFLPISSTGHLILAERLLHLPVSAWNLQGFAILLHAASLLALLLCTAKAWVRLLLSPVRRDAAALRMLVILLLATIPAATFGFFFEKFFAEEFRSIPAIALQLLISGLLLSFTDISSVRRKFADLSVAHAMFIGVAQATALVPGLSRSGMTIAAGRASGLSRSDAFEFSFLLATPAIFGAVLLTGVHVMRGETVLPAFPVSMAGFAASFISSALAVQFLRRIATRVSLHWFTGYLVLVSAVLLLPFAHLERFGDPFVVRMAIHRFGAIVVFLFAFIEAVPPISFFSPGVLVLVIGGAVMEWFSTGFLFFAAAAGGIVLGNMLFYLLGERYGRRWTGCLHITHERLARAEYFMQRFGMIGVFLSQFSGALRPVASFAAGALGVPRARYYPPMLAGASVFVAALLGLGFLWRRELGFILSVVSSAGFLIIVLVCILGWIGSLMHRKRAMPRGLPRK